MPKKPTKANIKAAAESGIKYHGGVDEAIASFEQSKALAEKANDPGGIETYERMIKYCQDR